MPRTSISSRAPFVVLFVVMGAAWGAMTIAAQDRVEEEQPAAAESGVKTAPAMPAGETPPGWIRA